MYASIAAPSGRALGRGASGGFATLTFALTTEIPLFTEVALLTDVALFVALFAVDVALVAVAPAAFTRGAVCAGLVLIAVPP
jgi:hypothetical protein